MNPGASASVQIPLVATTLGTWVEGGFVEVDPVGMPGLYQLGIPNAAIEGGGGAVTVIFSGATALRETVIDLIITATNDQDAVRGGLLALPDGSMMVKKGQALANFPFLMVSKADHVTPMVGLTPQCYVSVNGAAPVALANTPVELNAVIMPGVYTVNLTGAETNGNTLIYSFLSPNSDTRYIQVITQP
jgi:hypothetical protein